MKIHRSREDYLETILILERKGSAIRSIDIAEHLDFSKPSVSRAVSLLIADNLITMDKDKHISLTEQGREIASKVYEKHSFFKDFLEFVGVDPKTAAEDACMMEHVISNESFDKMKAAFEKHNIMGERPQ